MKRVKQSVKAAALLGVLVCVPAHAGTQAANQSQVDQAVAGCKGNRGTSIGQMPWGATDQDLISYKGKNLCTNNKGRPLGANCEKTLDKLYQVASELNHMVKAGCEKFMPMFVGNQELQKCMMGGQATCSESNKQQLAPVKAELARFRVKLKEFSGAMKEQQKYVAQSSDNVVQVLEQNESARNTPAYQNNGYSANQMGVSSISESDRLNNFQDAGVASAIVEGIKSRFENSESRYTNASEANYDKLRQPIEDSFEQVEQLQSRVLREQLHGYLKAEELKLATKLYDNQLSQTEATTDKLIATNEKSTANLSSLGAAAGAAPLLAGLGSQSSGSGLAGVDSFSPTGGVSHSPGSAEGSSTPVAEKNLTQLAELTNVGDGPGKSESGNEGSISTSAASRSPASNSSLREQLRKKLAGEKGAGVDAMGASVTGGAGSGAAEGTADAKEKGAGKGALGSAGLDGEGIGLGGGASDPMLEGFNVGSLDQGGLYIAGSGIDESVKELVGELESAIDANHQMSNDIGAPDSASLFARVREFHGRCLKRGCVTGMGKGEI